MERVEITVERCGFALAMNWLTQRACSDVSHLDGCTAPQLDLDAAHRRAESRAVNTVGRVGAQREAAPPGPQKPCCGTPRCDPSQSIEREARSLLLCVQCNLQSWPTT